MNKSLLLGLLAIAILLGGAWWLTQRPNEPSTTELDAMIARSDDQAATTPVSNKPNSDPRLTYATIFRNVKPDVAYVGDSNCAQCHQELCTTFHQHPMGRSAVLAGSDGLEKLDAQSMNPCQVGPYELSVRIEDGKMIHSLGAKTIDGQVLPSVDFPTSIAIGSGTRGRSYLVYDADSVWQSPVSWYSTKSRWDVLPVLI